MNSNQKPESHVIALDLQRLLKEVTKKDVRTMKWDINCIFNEKNWDIPTTIEEHQFHEFFDTHIVVKGTWIYLNEKAVIALRRLVTILRNYFDLSVLMTFNDMWQLLLKDMEHWLEKEQAPDHLDEFLVGFLPRLNELVTEQYTFLYRVQGLKFEADLDKLELGSLVLERYDPEKIKNLIRDDIVDKILDENFVGSNVIYGSMDGTMDAARERFLALSRQILSVVSLYFCVLNVRSMLKNDLRLVDAIEGGYAAAQSLCWERDSPHLTMLIPGVQKIISISDKEVKYIREQCFFDQCVGIIEKRVRSEVEESIVNAIFWFGEAARDPELTMKFVKLWSCAETFFSTSEEELTETNATGITAVLTYGGYGYIKPENYDTTKRKLKTFYGHRSKALHRARFGHLTTNDVMEFSLMIAWLVINIVAFTTRGVSSHQQILDECYRLDSFHSVEKNNPAREPCWQKLHRLVLGAIKGFRKSR